jgi:branched-subunit amino acid aminotransferase/4-amino-4-deoxychorismate lyase
LRSRMSAASRQRAREVFSIEAHGRRLQASYDRLCSPGVVHVDAESGLAQGAHSAK